MRTNLLAAMIAVSLFGAATAAHADPDPRTKHSTKRHVAKKKAAPVATETAAPAASSERAEIDALKAQLAAVQEKLANLEERTDAQSEVNTQQAKTNDDVAKSTAKTDKLEKLVNDTSITGVIFADMSNLTIKDNGVKKAANNGIGFDVKRAYIGINHKFNDTYSANITTDFQYLGTINGTAINSTELFIKKAYLQGKYSDAFIVRLGSADMPWIGYADSQHPYRYVENSLVDRMKVGNSADWGLHVLGNLGSNGMFNYAASVVNGGGYKNPTRSKGVDVEARVGVTPIEGLNLSVGGYHGKLGKEAYPTNTPTEHSANRIDGMIGYGNKWFHVGGEYFQANNWNRVLLGTAAPPSAVGGYGLPVYAPATPTNLKPYVGDRARGWAMFGNVNFTDKMSLFGRYDQADVSRWLDPALKDKYYNIGLDYALTKGVKVAAVYKHEDVKDNSKTNAKADEFGLWTEVKW
ncbi:porin [Solilutibacter silvestris]|uniref:Phosphate-selective porin O/P n=1 Tax=Solilutibacter silvestris TaxID=1645665 RepID=A0A2K1PYC8_9GAMM|nr:porin [Lysobacter silvestris]PNS07687.1 Phosphate-selective porin O/P [Lysobacter silvestris]